MDRMVNYYSNDSDNFMSPRLGISSSMESLKTEQEIVEEDQIYHNEVVTYNPITFCLDSDGLEILDSEFSDSLASDEEIIETEFIYPHTFTTQKSHQNQEGFDGFNGTDSNDFSELFHTDLAENFQNNKIWNAENNHTTDDSGLEDLMNLDLGTFGSLKSLPSVEEIIEVEKMATIYPVSTISTQTSESIQNDFYPSDITDSEDLLEFSNLDFLGNFEKDEYFFDIESDDFQDISFTDNLETFGGNDTLEVENKGWNGKDITLFEINNRYETKEEFLRSSRQHNSFNSSNHLPTITTEYIDSDYLMSSGPLILESSDHPRLARLPGRSLSEPTGRTEPPPPWHRKRHRTISTVEKMTPENSKKIKSREYSAKYKKLEREREEELADRQRKLEDEIPELKRSNNRLKSRLKIGKKEMKKMRKEVKIPVELIVKEMQTEIAIKSVEKRLEDVKKRQEARNGIRSTLASQKSRGLAKLRFLKAELEITKLEIEKATEKELGLRLTAKFEASSNSEGKENDENRPGLKNEQRKVLEEIAIQEPEFRPSSILKSAQWSSETDMVEDF